MEKSESQALSSFHPLIARWFFERVGRPTDVQSQAWPKIASGRHVLITAPTGSGKTLAAFLWAIHQLTIKNWPTGRTSVLYVSPLKALNNDIQRNLLAPLEEIRKVFQSRGEHFPTIRVLTRSGDTPASDRRRMLRHPSEILITTPESLNLLLSSAGGRTLLTNLSTVILDEIHAVIGNKRGTHLITAVDRLVHLSGDFQRIGLSATIKPLQIVAEFMGGYRMEGGSSNPRYTPRKVAVIESRLNKQYDVKIKTPEEDTEISSAESFWDPLIAEFKTIIGRNRSTLLFTNSRRLAEKITLKINGDQPNPIAYAHHGSLSREIRADVEQKLKRGELKAIVATSSLELGIDIGALDEVILIQSPPAISSAIQRIGRAGHRVGEVSRGTAFPTHSHDFLEAAVSMPAILNQDIEEVKPVRCPLDVLAQIIVSMVCMETWNIDALYTRLRTSHPYHHLTRQQFDLVLNMLAGRYAETRIRDLKPCISIDRLDNTVAGKKGAVLSLYTSGGTIPDRGYFHLRHHQTSARIGDLDEEFVWEAVLGQIFTLGTQNWKIDRITHNDVFVAPAGVKSTAAPFWKGEGFNRDFYFSNKIADFLETANDRLRDPHFAKNLQDEYAMDERAAERLIDYLKNQKQATDTDLPHRHHLVIEHVASGPGGAPGNQVILHTVWGGRVNRPFAMSLSAAWEKRFGHKLKVHVGNDCIIIVLPNDIDGDELISLVTPNSVESHLRKRLEGSGFFGARFRECAGRALLLTRSSINRRMPLWMNRLRSQKLLQSVLEYEDFPILLEAWRTCLQDDFDIDALKSVLAEIESGIIKITETHTKTPSPMAQAVAWRQVNEYMYSPDGLDSDKASKLRTDLLRDVVFTPGLRPTVSSEIIAAFEQKWHRLSPGYSPSTARDLVDWVKERWLIPQPEWDSLVESIRRDYRDDAEDIIESAKLKLAKISPPRTIQSLIVSLEQADRISGSFYLHMDDLIIEPLGEHSTKPSGKPDPASTAEDDTESNLTEILGEWFRFYGPRSIEFIHETLGIQLDRLNPAIDDLIDSDNIISGQLVTDGPKDDLCDAENFEILLRMARSEARPSFEPLDIEYLPLFLAMYQGLVHPSDDIDGLFRRIEQLQCYPMPAAAWEADILPARLQPYVAPWLDIILQEGDLRWIGTENQKVAFCFESDLDLLEKEIDRRQNEEKSSDIITDKADPNIRADVAETRKLFPDPVGRYNFSSLMQITGDRPAQLSNNLWEGVWQRRVTNDTFSALRKGLEIRFRLPDILAEDRKTRIRTRRAGGRSRFSRWKGSLPYAGNWFLLPEPELDDDLLAVEERNKDRVRLLLERYGILFRELLQRESEPYRWKHLFRSLRLMELSGEVLSGYFFHGIPGPQFISHRAFRTLQRDLPQEAVYWINAADPASACGLPIEGIRGNLPRRLDSTHLVYRGEKLVFVSKKNGASLRFSVSPDDPGIHEYLCVLKHLLARDFQPKRRITIETINGKPAACSPYSDVIRTHFETVVDHKHITLYKNVE